MEPDLDTHFTRRLLSAESLLYEITDRTSLAAFDTLWMPLTDDLEAAFEAESLNTSTISMVYNLAHRVPIVMKAFLDVEVLSEQLMSTLDIEASAILDSSSDMVNPTSLLCPTIASPKDFHNTTIDFALPKYIEPSYKWLLQNIHNPYPPTHIRNAIAKATGSPRKDIDGWFIDARKRIGWNALRKEHFSNKRADIVEAATQFFITRESTQPPHMPTTDVDFAAIESNARDLYSNKFFQSDLATRLDTVVKDMTPEMKVQAKAEERRRRLLEKEKSQDTRAISSYPSPDRSPSYSSPSPLPLPNEDDPETTLPRLISQSSRKRRASSTELLDLEDEISSNKRPRIDTLFHDGAASTTGLLSPASSVHESLANHQGMGSPIESATPPGIVHISSRKRRLSDAESQSASKRVHIHHVGTRPKAASNPLPFSSALLAASKFDEWFNNHVEHSNPPDVQSDSSAPLEVELYDFSDLYNEKQLTNVVQYPSPQIQDHSGLLSTIELPDVLSFDLDISANALNYDELFSSDDYTEDFGAHDASQPSNPSNFSYELSSSLGIDFSPNFFNFCEMQMQPHMADHTLVVDSSLPISNNPAARPYWAFPSSISSPSSATIPSDKFQNLLNIFPQTVDTFNSSMTIHPNPTELLQSMNLMTDSPVSAQTERAAKQQKLFEIKETARRLEAELAATSC